MITRQDMTDQVVETLTAWADEFDVPGIVDDLMDRYGRVDIDEIVPEVYWVIVERRAHSPEEAAAAQVRAIVERLDTFDGVDVWEEVIYGLPYDEIATNRLDPRFFGNVFVTTDGVRFARDASGAWNATMPGEWHYDDGSVWQSAKEKSIA